VTGGLVDYNPYQAPKADLWESARPLPADSEASGPGERPEYRLYSPGQVAAAAFLSGPFGGFWLLASNYRALGARRQATRTVVWGVAATAVLLPLVLLLPDKFPNFILPAAYTGAIYQLAKQLQGKSYRQHLARGGAARSNWRVIGISLVWLVIVVALLVAVAAAYLVAFGE
jgi:hypothetical protein